MSNLPLLLIIVAGLFTLCSVIALIISGFHGKAYQSKLSELEKHMRATSGEPNNAQRHRADRL